MAPALAFCANEALNVFVSLRHHRPTSTLDPCLTLTASCMDGRRVMTVPAHIWRLGFGLSGNADGSVWLGAVAVAVA